MDKKDCKRVLASIGAVLVLLAASGCNVKLDLNKVFSDKEIESYAPDQNLKTISRAYKDSFFEALPLIRTYNCDKKEINDLFSSFYIDFNYDSAYVFLNEYLNCIKSLYKDSFSKEDIYILADYNKPDEYSNSASFEFQKNGKNYYMDFYEKDYILNYYETINQRCSYDGKTFIKSYYYKFNKLPGDKNSAKDKAAWEVSYKLDINYQEKHYQVVISDSNVINEKKEVVNTLESQKHMMVYCDGVLVIEKELSNKEFNDYTTFMYQCFFNEEELTLQEEDNKVLKLIKNQD